ncbi:MAG: hypothetical protein IIU14_04585 [Ruminococcus sp.]|nr:hypothetical protein [Ruminococcus sp.]
MTDFFSRPIVLITSIVFFAQAVARFVLSLFNLSVWSALFENRFYEVNLFELFMGLSLLLLYVMSVKGNSLAASVKFFRVGSIVELVLTALFVCCCVMAFFVFFFFGALFSGVFFLRFFPMVIVAGLVVIFALIAVILLITMLSAQTAFSVSLVRSVRDGKKRKGTAVFYGVMNLVSAVCLLLFALIISLFDTNMIAFLLSGPLLSLPSLALMSVLLLSYK